MSDRRQFEAGATAIVRQVVRADTATKLNHRFSNVHGERFAVGPLTFSTFSTAEIVLGLSDEHFARAGMTFKREPLRAAAEAFCKFGESWREITPMEHRFAWCLARRYPAARSHTERMFEALTSQLHSSRYVERMF